MNEAQSFISVYMSTEKNLLPTEIILTPARQCIGRLNLNRRLQPGNYMDFEGKTYAILERHHFYQYRPSYSYLIFLIVIFAAFE